MWMLKPVIMKNKKIDSETLTVLFSSIVFQTFFVNQWWPVFNPVSNSSLPCVGYFAPLISSSFTLYPC